MKFVFLSILVLCFSIAHAQQQTFSKYYNVGNATSLRFYDCKQNLDGSFVATGIRTVTSGATTTEQPLLAKLDCNGNVDWARYYGNSTGNGNIFMKVINTFDSGFIMLNNIGNPNALNVLLVKYDKNGNESWKTVVNNGGGNDVGQSIVQTVDSGFVVAGTTSSFGPDALSPFYNDILLFKLDKSGNFVWGKAYGNAGAYNEASALIETVDGGLALTGRYLTQGYFFSYLLKADQAGVLQFIKSYGAINHSTYGLDVKQDADSNFYLCGTTTALKTNYQSYTDHFILKAKPNGDTLWCRAFYGSSTDAFESPYSICFDQHKNIILAIETNSYPSTAIVQNKQGYLQLDSNGHLIAAKLFNDRQSQYTRIYNTIDGGYIASGFTTINTNAYFRPTLYKLDSNLNTTCSWIDVSALTFEAPAPFTIITPPYSTANGGTAVNYTVTNNFAFNDTTLCAYTPALTASFAIQDTCLGQLTQFSYNGNNNATYFKWHIYSAGFDTVIYNTNLALYLPASGSYTASLLVADACNADSSAHQFNIHSYPNAAISANPSTPGFLGDSVQLSVNLNAGASALWSTNQSSASIYVYNNATYVVTVTENSCSSSDSVTIKFQDTVATGLANNLQDSIFVPNAFSPDGMVNKTFRPIAQGAVEILNIQIYNRWGQLIYAGQGAQAAWNGCFNGKACSSDSYYYNISYKKYNKTRYLNGTLLLLR